MPGTVEEYRNFVITWDVTEVPGTVFWKGTGAVILPADASGINRAYSLPGDLNHFTSEEEAEDYLVRTARDWIDARLERTTSR